VNAKLPIAPFSLVVEVIRNGWNKHKIGRLTRAGVDLLGADFALSADLFNLLIS
jgi:hypothetical protein